MQPQEKESFWVNRWKSMGYALRGFWLLLNTESAVKIHFSFAVFFVIAGLFTGLSPVSWAIQMLVFGLILAVESLNTAIEKVCDFIHPDFHNRIGFIKDIAAGAVTFAVFFGYSAIAFLYIPIWL